MTDLAGLLIMMGMIALAVGFHDGMTNIANALCYKADTEKENRDDR